MSNRNRNQDLGPYEEEYRGFDIRDDDSARGPLILSLAIGVLIVFGAVVWNTYRQGVRPTDGALPMVVAEAQPYKRVPDDRGGIQIEDLDRRLYDAMDGSSRRPEPTQVASKGDAYLRGGPPMDLRPTGQTEPGSKPEEAAAPKPETSGAADPVEAEQRPQLETPAPVEIAAATPPAPERTASQPTYRFAYTRGGEYLVQISALRSEQAATDAWAKARRTNPDIFEGASMSIERADLGAKGVFYRLRAGAFGSRDSASEFCDALKAEGADCIVVRETA
ncbi:MAG: SPOR domain-containing protein [Henriciella sp.]|uniref:SPOR domain-containing protein n=1 Tax=Henriciella sp. TaxID=1968823 RepID=UPI003C75834E